MRSAARGQVRTLHRATHAGRRAAVRVRAIAVAEAPSARVGRDLEQAQTVRAVRSRQRTVAVFGASHAARLGARPRTARRRRGAVRIHCAGCAKRSRDVTRRTPRRTVHITLARDAALLRDVARGRDTGAMRVGEAAHADVTRDVTRAPRTLRVAVARDTFPRDTSRRRGIETRQSLAALRTFRHVGPGQPRQLRETDSASARAFLFGERDPAAAARSVGCEHRGKPGRRHRRSTRRVLIADRHAGSDGKISAAIAWCVDETVEGRARVHGACAAGVVRTTERERHSKQQ